MVHVHRSSVGASYDEARRDARLHRAADRAKHALHRPMPESAITPLVAAGLAGIRAHYILSDLGGARSSPDGPSWSASSHAWASGAPRSSSASSAALVAPVAPRRPSPRPCASSRAPHDRHRHQYPAGAPAGLGARAVHSLGLCGDELSLNIRLVGTAPSVSASAPPSCPKHGPHCVASPLYVMGHLTIRDCVRESLGCFFNADIDMATSRRWNPPVGEGLRGCLENSLAPLPTPVVRDVVRATNVAAGVREPLALLAQGSSLAPALAPLFHWANLSSAHRRRSMTHLPARPSTLR